MTVKTEGQHAGEFIVSEANGTLSREARTLSSGVVLLDGDLVQLGGTGGVELVKKDANLNTEGDFVTPIEGIVIGNWDSSATGTNADIKNVPYIKRLAEVKDALILYPAGAGREAAAQEELAAKNIVVR